MRCLCSIFVVVTLNSISNIAFANPVAERFFEKIHGASDEKLRSEWIPWLYAQPLTKEFLDSVVIAWAGDKKQYPNAPWSALSNPSVRIALAQFLAQAFDNSATRYPVEAKQFVTPFLQDKNAELRADAIAFFGATGTKSEMHILVKACGDAARAVALRAVVYLSRRTDEGRVSWLKNCEANAKDDAVRIRASEASKHISRR